jgi:hypothetical protein
MTLRKLSEIQNSNHFRGCYRSLVRDCSTHGLVAGLVDVKICAINEIWSGQKFEYRLKDRLT